jgi:hypothetical protein
VVQGSDDVFLAERARLSDGGFPEPQAPVHPEDPPRR